MPYFTGVVLAAFVAYMGGWYLGYIEGNMALLLTVAVLVTGLYWLAEKFWFLPQRRKAAEQFAQHHAQQQASLSAQGVAGDAVDVHATQERLLEQPWWLDWTAGLFPVILIVFLLRSFAYEPFKIPSGSMLPTLEIGDLILVDKHVWGLRLPVLNTKITKGNPVQRGEVIVFHYPPQPSVDYIKRVVGLPGDTVSYLNKKLTINGKEIDRVAQPNYLGEKEGTDALAGKPVRQFGYFQQFEEQLGAHTHRILIDETRPAAIPVIAAFPNSSNCRYSMEGVTCKVPEGQYFVMGDNRDNSADSRFWGFVPDANVVGKAVAVWMNFSNFKRIGAVE